MPDIARPVYYFGVHLLYASLVWCAAWVLTLTCRGSATTKFWIWVVASLNFILPVGAVLDKVWAGPLSWASPLGAIGEAWFFVIEHAFVVGAVWSLGAIFMAARLYLRIRAGRRDTHDGRGATVSTPRFFIHGMPVAFAPARSGPVVVGILRPHISLPYGIDQLLTKSELNAVLLHELTHARRRDNLIWLIHEAGLCLLWFHPLVWIASSRLALYRELSCDESVILSAQGDELVSALAKLARPESTFLLESSASSFMSRRLAQLSSGRTQRTSGAANTLLTFVFGAVLIVGSKAAGWPSAAILNRIETSGGVVQVTQQLREARRHDPKAQLFPETILNTMGYDHLRAGKTKAALDILKLNATAYPESANANDSLSDAYLAAGQIDLAQQYAEMALALLVSDTSDPEKRRTVIRNSAQRKLKQPGTAR